MLFLLVSECFLILTTIHLISATKMNVSGLALFQQPIEIGRLALITLVCQLCLYYNDLYDLRVTSGSRDTFIRLMQAMGVCSIAVAVIYRVFPRTFLGPGVFLLAVMLLLGVLGGWRSAFFWINQKFGFRRPILILGTGELAQKVASEILGRPETGIRIVGFVAEDPALVGKSLVNPSVVGVNNDLLEIVKDEGIDEVVVAIPERRGRMPVGELLELKMKGISVVDATTLYEKITGKIAVENLRPSWLIFAPGFKKSKFTHLYKRVFGMSLSLLGMLLSAPLMAVIAILIKLESRGPVLLRQERVGENGKVFSLYKFRSMYLDAEERSGPVWAKANDARVTRVGRLIRRARLDELPQFVNVLKGDMSFVGPRPERPHFVDQLKKEIPYYNQRHSVKPGITGWAQIRYQYGSSVADTVEKLQYDLFYIKNMSIVLDLFILFQTVKIVVQRRGAV
jgi:sugar transferase (PEP-CTERM system associated)